MFDKNGQWIKHVFVVFLYAAITLMASYKVLPNDGILTVGDNAYFHNIDTSWRDIASTSSPNYLGQDQSNTIFNYFPKIILTFILKIFSIGDSNIGYILFFGLFFLTSILYYWIFYRISGNYYFGILSGLFVVLNNLSIEHIAFGGVRNYFFGLMSFAFLFCFLFKIYRKSVVSYRDIVLIILNSLLITLPFYFFIYVVLLLFFSCFYLIRSNAFRIFQNWLKYFTIFMGITLAHSYWLIPFLYGSFNRNPNETYGGNLDNVFEGFKKASSYVGAVDFFQYFNLFSKNFHQSMFHYIFYFGIVISLVVSIIYLKNKKNKSLLLFVLTSYLLFFFFALGPNSGPTGSVWTWMWNNISFFQFFRSFSRFLIIIIPLCLFYFAIFNLEWKYKHKSFVYVLISIAIIVMNASVLTGNLKGNILATKIPNEYFYLNQKYFNNDQTENNIISFPNQPYERYAWGMNENIEIMQQNYFLEDYLFSKPVIFERSSLNLGNKNNIFKKVFSQNENSDEYFNSLYKLNIGYVLVHKDLIDYGKMIAYDKSDEYFQHKKYYTLLEENNYFKLYKVEKNSSIIGGNEVSFKKINSTKYRVFIKNIKSRESLIFLNNFNNNWKIYLKKNPSDSWCQKIGYYEDEKTTECKSEQKFFEGEELFYLYKKPVFDDKHKIVNQYANKWTIDPHYIKQNFSKEYYGENPDGSIDVEMVLYFKPQSYFYLGLLISGTTLFGCLGYLLYDWRKRRKYKNELDGKISEKIL